MGTGKTVETPAGLAAHQANDKPRAWEADALYELGDGVHRLSKRAAHPDDPEKKAKDPHDAQNDPDMMQAKLNALKS